MSLVVVTLLSIPLTIDAGNTEVIPSAANPQIAGNGAPSGILPPTGLTGFIDSSYNMNLSWATSMGATSYLVERETLSTGTWSTLGTATGSTYQDTGYGSGGYHYRVSSVSSSGTSSSSNEFPLFLYAYIDLGANIYPYKVTNSGYILYSKVNYQLSSNGIWYQGNILPLLPKNQSETITLADISESGTVVGGEFVAVSSNLSNEELAVWPAGTSTPNLTAGPLVTNPLAYAGEAYDIGRSIDAKGDIWTYELSPSDAYDGYANNLKMGTAIYSDTGAETGTDVYPLVSNNQGDLLTQMGSYQAGAFQGYTYYFNNVALSFQPTDVSNEIGGNVFVVGVENSGVFDIWNSRTQTIQAAPQAPTYGDNANISAETTVLNGQIVPAAHLINDAYLWTMNPATGQFQKPNSLIDVISDANTGWNYFAIGYPRHPINDNGAIVVQGYYTSKGPNDPVAAGEHGVLLLPAELAVDANRDGTIVMVNDAGNPNNVDSHGNPLPVDTTSQANPYRFWFNNNEDQQSTFYGITYPNTVPPVASNEDYLSDSIVSIGDLEDWTRLWIYTKGLNAAINAGTIKVGLKWVPSSGTTPGIKLMTAAAADGGLECLTDTTGAAAIAQTNADPNDPNSHVSAGGYTGLVANRLVIKDASDGHTNIVPNTTGAAADFVFPQWVWHGLSDSSPKTFFLFEGTSEGQGQLQIVFLKSDGTTLLGTGGNLYLDIRDIKEMYQRAIAAGAGPTPTPPTEPYASNSGAFNDSTITTSLDTNNPFVAPFGETSQCVVFVHGWQTNWNGFTDYSERFFKRLWWQGYKGRFIGFTWPALTGTATYNSSEWNAWLYGRAFKNYVNSIKGNYTNFTVAGHSQGNVVVGSAIQEGLTIPNYILLEAAEPTGLYTTNSTYNNYAPFITQEATQPTPDLATSLGYVGFITPSIGNVRTYYCFYNPQDFALATGSFLWGTLSANWEANQLSYKPDSNPGQSGDGFYGYASGYGVDRPFFTPASSSTYRNLAEIHESMSFVARSRSKAAGADPNSPAVFGAANATDLNATYGFGATLPDHSGQFLRDYDQVYPLYIKLEGIIAPPTP